MTQKQAAEAMREAAAKAVEPKNERPCDCDQCYCGNQGDAEMVARWDEAKMNATAIRALPLPADPASGGGVDMVDLYNRIAELERIIRLSGDSCGELLAVRDAEITKLQAALENMPMYDAGLINNWGGGDVEWWQNYIRSELARAHEFYVAYLASIKQAGAVSHDAKRAR